jgi:hypothetical protein
VIHERAAETGGQQAFSKGRASGGATSVPMPPPWRRGGACALSRTRSRSGHSGSAGSWRTCSSIGAGSSVARGSSVGRGTPG